MPRKPWSVFVMIGDISILKTAKRSCLAYIIINSARHDDGRHSFITVYHDRFEHTYLKFLCFIIMDEMTTSDDGVEWADERINR